MCLAENAHGQDTASATLAVQVLFTFLSISLRVDIVINSSDPITLKCSLQGYPLSTLHWRKDDTPLAPDGSHINITTFRRQDPMGTYPFSSVLDSNFQPILQEGLEYFEAVSELTLVPPILRNVTANYTCEAGTDFVQNYTVTSDNIAVNEFVTTIVQVYLRQVSNCPTWVENNTEAKLLGISAALLVPLQQNCSCSLFVQRRFFSCPGTEDSQTVVFLAELSYIAFPGVDLSSFLTSWVMSTPHVDSTRLQVDTACPVVIDSLEPESCSIATPTGMPTDVTVIAVAAGAGGVVLVAVIIIVATVIAVVRCCIRQSKHSLDHPQPDSVYDECEYVNSGSGDVVLEDMTKNPAYKTTREAVTKFTFGSLTERSKDEEESYAYEVLPFDANREGQGDTTHGRLENAVDGIPVYANL